MQERITEAVLNITGNERNEKTCLFITSMISQILSYLNRESVDEKLFPCVVEVIAECLNSGSFNNDRIQSLKEGDLSITYSNLSPFFGKLDSFKVIRGIN